MSFSDHRVRNTSELFGQRLIEFDTSCLRLCGVITYIKATSITRYLLAPFIQDEIILPPQLQSLKNFENLVLWKHINIQIHFENPVLLKHISIQIKSEPAEASPWCLPNRNEYVTKSLQVSKITTLAYNLKYMRRVLSYWPRLFNQHHWNPSLNPINHHLVRNHASGNVTIKQIIGCNSVILTRTICVIGNQRLFGIIIIPLWPGFSVVHSTTGNGKL